MFSWFPLPAVALCLTAAAALAGPALQLSTACDYPPPAAPAGSTDYYHDLPYATLAGYSERYDLAVPTAPGKYPLLILLHGGGFKVGDKTDKFPEPELRDLAARGYAVATVDYALAGDAAGRGPDSHFPQAIMDVRCALQYFRTADEPQLDRIDTSRVGVLGTSAGGHLALLLATAADETAFDDAACPWRGASMQVQAVAAFYPSTRFVTAAGDQWSGYRNVGKQSDFYQIFGTQPSQVEDLIRLGSPLYRVETGLAGPDVPPILLVNAGAERNPLLTEGTLAFEAALADKGLPHVLITEPKAHHGFDPFGQFKTSTCAALNFMDQEIGTAP